MHRLLVSTDLLEQDAPVLPSSAAKHLKVLRPESGEQIELFDGHGGSRVYAWRDGLCAVSPISRMARASRSLTLFACITKGSRWDWTIEKATELGVTRIVPVISDRTIVRIPRSERAAKRERWQRIAEDAARQSDAKWLPEICEATDFRDALALVKETTCFVGALTNPPPRPLIAAVADKVKVGGEGEQRNWATFVGPEGDFTPDELAALLEIATPTSFGPTVLRAETAAIFAVSILSGCANGL